MKPAVKFIHTADLHLGSRLQINNDSNLDNDYQEAVYNSFAKIVNQAIENEVHFVLIAGDVFDNEARSVRATRFFKEQCLKLNENDINVYIINGNHDPYRIEGELLELPSNVKICDSEDVSQFQVYENDKMIARILGQSYRGSSESRKMFTYYTTPDQSVYNIGLLHTQLEPNNSNYVPVSKEELKNHNHIDYWALGHIHQKRIINDHIPYIIYPGIPQGRDIGEPGLGGFFMVHLEPENTYYEFKKTSDFVFKQIDLNIEEMEEDTISELNYYLKEELEKIYQSFDKEIKGYVIRLLLKGSTEIYDILNEQEEEVLNDLLTNLRPYFSKKSPSLWINNIINHTSKKVANMKEIKENDPFIKEFNNFVENLVDNEKERAKLKQKMGKIWNPEVDFEDQNPKEFQITEQEFTELFQQAKDKILTEFIERRDL
jgi:DNA repair exonuclease SbcCD nuclease subunit